MRDFVCLDHRYFLSLIACLGATSRVIGELHKATQFSLAAGGRHYVVGFNVH